MKKRLLHLLALMCSIYTYGQTVLYSGDALVVGINANISGGEDEISIVFFKDVTTGTQFDLTDNGLCNTTALTWRDTEGAWRFTRTGATIVAGTVVTFRNDGTNTGNWVCVSPDNNWSYSNQNVGTSGLNLNSSSPGDQLYILQGGTWNNPAGTDDATYSGRIISGFNLSTIWNAATCGPNVSYQHPMCCHFFTWNSGTAARLKFNADLFVSGTINDWITRILDASNWSLHSTTGIYNGLDPVYSAGYNIVITTNYYPNAVWQGSVDTNWFNCNNWDVKKIPESQTAVGVVALPDAVNNRNCCISVPAGTITTATCASINWVINNVEVKSLNVRGGYALIVGGNINIQKGTGVADLPFAITGGGTLVCQNLTLNGSAANRTATFYNMNAANDITINGNLLISGTGGRYNTTNGTIKLYGNYTNNNSNAATIITGSTFRFLGSTNQTISTNSFKEDFATLVVNKPSGILFVNNHMEIRTNMTFTSGRVDNSQRITFIAGTTATGMSNNSFCLGQVAKIGNTAFTFPVGDDQFYSPISISAPTGAGSRFVAKYYKSNSHPLYNHASKVPTLDNLSDCEYWTLDRDSLTSAVNVTLSWNNSRHTGPTCHVFVLPDLRVARWDGSMWQNHGNGGTTGTAAAGTITTSAAVTAFSPFTISSTTNLNPLPIDLLYFNASFVQNKVELIWESVNEALLDKYVLCHSTNGIDYTYLASVDAKNNSNTMAQYKYIHNESVKHNYYKLKAVDVNGAYTEFQKVVYVSVDNPELYWHYIDNQIIINASENYRFKLIDISGRVVQSTQLMAGYNRVYMDNKQTGIYFIVIENDYRAVTGKIFIPSR